MTSLLSMVASLALVLALLGFTLRMLRRYTATVAGSGRVPLQVLQRVGLGPRQGIALVRIGERVLAVSLGEGGVRPLLELEDEELDALRARGARPRLRRSRATSARHCAPRFATRLRTAAVAAVLAGAGSFAPTAAHAQAAAGTPAAPGQVARPTPVRPTPPRLTPEAAAQTEQIDRMLPKLAPQMDLRVGQPGDGGLRLSGTVGVVIMMGLLTLLPTLLLMMTSFTRILIVLSFLRQAMGTQSAPPGHLMAGLALLLTGFVMAPTIGEVNRTALEPWMAGQIEQAEMLKVGAEPFRKFMLAQTRERDIQTFLEMSDSPAPDRIEDVPLVVLTSAFVTSELKTAFQLGFALFLPFIIIDVVVSAVLMSMGMMMLPAGDDLAPLQAAAFRAGGWLDAGGAGADHELSVGRNGGRACSRRLAGYNGPRYIVVAVCCELGARR